MSQMVDNLANLIRCIDGAHTMGAGALAAHLVDHGVAYAPEFEYGVAATHTSGVRFPIDPHRERMTKNQAFDWVKETHDMFPNRTAKDIYYVIRRARGNWERYDA